jgi:hypothetical protein
VEVDGGYTVTHTFNNANEPTISRQKMGASSSGGPITQEHVAVLIGSNGATTGPETGAPAPIVYSVAVAFEDTAALVPGTGTA